MVFMTPVERNLSANSGRMITAAPRPTNGRAEKKPFWNHQIANAQINIKYEERICRQRISNRGEIQDTILTPDEVSYNQRS